MTEQTHNEMESKKVVKNYSHDQSFFDSVKVLLLGTELNIVPFFSSNGV